MLRNIGSREPPQSDCKVGFYFPNSIPSVTPHIHKRNYDYMLELHMAYKLFDRMKVVRTVGATFKQLEKFHSTEYLTMVHNLSTKNGRLTFSDGTLEDYGLEDDVEEVDQLWDHVCAIAGASLSASHNLVHQEVDVAISYSGGRHHAKKGEAAGYCYVNDAVLSILYLRQKFPRVMYVDLDVHHGDGVEEAFNYSQDVMTLSIHKYGVGFFPHTGGLKNIGKGVGMLIYDYL